MLSIAVSGYIDEQILKYLSFVPVKIYFRKYLTPGIWIKW